MKRNKKEAVLAILADYNNYELKPLSYNQLYRKCFWDKNREQYRVIGKAHDYSF
jgi:hypothetical protein